MVLLVARSRGALRTATTGPENERADAQPTTATAAIEQFPEEASVSPGIAEKLTNPITPALTHSAPPSKKSKAVSGAPMALTPPGRAPSRQNATVDAATISAHAPAPRFGRDAFDPYGDASRPTAPQSGLDARFGRYR